MHAPVAPIRTRPGLTALQLLAVVVPARAAGARATTEGHRRLAASDDFPGTP